MIAAAVLAAGRGERLGGTTPKPLLAFRGQPLLSYACAAAVGSGLEPVVVVVGHAASDVEQAAPAGVEVVANPAYASGIASSLVAALRALEPRRDIDGVVIGLADQPLVGAEGYSRVAAAYDGGARLAVATYEGVRGNPVLLAREMWPEALQLTGDEGARVLLRRHGGVEVPCDGTGEPTDVDTMSDLDALETRWRSTTASE